MDLPVVATVHLNIFSNKTVVRDLLRSHGFVLTDLGSDQVRVEGSYLKLKAVKASLEQLLDSQTTTDFTQVPKASTGAISKRHNSNSSVSDGNRGRNKPPHASPSSRTTFPSRASRESFVVDVDLFRYADRLRKEDIVGILKNHDVNMEVDDIGESINITLQGKRARTAVGKLQSLLNDLNNSLRTQEVPLKDMDHEGKALLGKIRNDENIYNSVLVCLINDKVHLIGPSGEGFELKERLLGRPREQSGRTGRTLVRSSTTRDRGAVDKISPAAGYSPPAEPKLRAATVSRYFRRSRSDPCRRSREERVNMQEVVNRTPKSPKKLFSRILKFFNIHKGK
ncbi:RNA-binding protein 43 [Cottoperca gobio]|uniref:Uncharacterized protein LOC115015712 n=1 Tax=Cottoperca gobio TaxID=56716 RepID=A0A6J2QME7_COTGO|nr:uncharacterized protein LOC115015712 [Cottoperca gobio]XP_029299098.1 uncharacterized protein LOC115015712 [Cottoperca gobio]XP_029299099.1 uncharacterized protein LOC115015712 [Cottoperca gobio]XP_029299100.1 uncharacterized protein LOC115015712 [Cottoperca gobio]